jgi:hypothetical protein
LGRRLAEQAPEPDIDEMFSMPDKIKSLLMNPLM